MDQHSKPPKLVGRLAPSPTGVLHFGNARSFLLAWLSIRSRGGQIRLRIEDIDSPRVVPKSEQSVIEDLEWMGLDWDGPVVRQSERLDLYKAAASKLSHLGKTFPCVCTRKDIEEAASAPHLDFHEQRIYPKTCRGKFRNCEVARDRTGKAASLRFLVDQLEFPFEDGFCGPQSGFLGGDFVIQKKDGGPAYQLAVVVDDAAQGITEVLRADDLLPSTPKQLMIYQALNWVPPTFQHVPLVIGPDGKRLAKRHGDTSLSSFRKQGTTASQLIGALALSCGLQNDLKPCRPRDLIESFDLQLLPRTPIVFCDDILNP